MRILCLVGFVTFGLAFLSRLVFVSFGGGERSMVYWKVWLSPRPVGIADTQLLFHPFSPVQPRDGGQARGWDSCSWLNTRAASRMSL